MSDRNVEIHQSDWAQSPQYECKNMSERTIKASPVFWLHI